jgi:hypothetical protein
LTRISGSVLYSLEAGTGHPGGGMPAILRERASTALQTQNNDIVGSQNLHGGRRASFAPSATHPGTRMHRALQ